MWIRTLNGIEFIPITLTIQGLPITKTNNMAQQTECYPKDRNGQIVKIGDKVKGFGSLRFQDGFEIDRTPIVTANIQNGVLYFGNLSAKSFTDGFEIVKNK